MKILIYGINYLPEPTGIGKYTGEMATWLAAQGHEVRVIAAPPYYPDWKVSPGFNASGYDHCTEQGLSVWRCPIWVPKMPTGKKRVVHLASFALSSLPILLAQVFWRPDLVWVAAPAFACTPGALLTAKLSGASSWLHVQDFEVDAAFDLGLLKGQTLRKAISAVEGWLMRRFDVASSISHRMVQRLSSKGVSPERTLYFPNWVDVNAVVPLDRPSLYKAELGIAPDAVVALFSGTLAAKQGLHMLPEVAKLLAQSAPHVHMVICGDGAMKPHLQQATAGLSNVTMIPLQPKERVPELLGLADIHLLPQDVCVADLVMPSKLSAMLSSGRPVVSTAEPSSEVGQVVAPAGLLAQPGSVQAFADAIAQLSDNPELRQQLGAQGRAYAEQHLSIEGALGKFLHRASARRSKGMSEEASPCGPEAEEHREIA